MRGALVPLLVAGLVVGLPAPASASGGDCRIDGPLLLTGGQVVCNLTCKAGQSLTLTLDGVAVSAEANCGNQWMGCENTLSCVNGPMKIAKDSTGECFVHSIRGIPVIGALPGVLQDVSCTVE